jgi:hypothetical protein
MRNYVPNRLGSMPEGFNGTIDVLPARTRAAFDGQLTGGRQRALAF